MLLLWLLLLRGRGRLCEIELVAVVDDVGGAGVVVFCGIEAKGLIRIGGDASKPSIIRSTRSSAERLANSTRVALSCLVP